MLYAPSCQNPMVMRCKAARSAKRCLTAVPSMPPGAISARMPVFAVGAPSPGEALNARVGVASCAGEGRCAGRLCRAGLCRTGLCRAELCGAGLCWVGLCWVGLCGVGFCRAGLCRRGLCEARLCGTGLWEARLCRAGLRRAGLRGAGLYVPAGVMSASRMTSSTMVCRRGSSPLKRLSRAVPNSGCPGRGASVDAAARLAGGGAATEPAVAGLAGIRRGGGRLLLFLVASRPALGAGVLSATRNGRAACGVSREGQPNSGAAWGMPPGIDGMVLTSLLENQVCVVHDCGTAPVVPAAVLALGAIWVTRE